MSALMKIILRVLFVDGFANFTKGFTYLRKGGIEFGRASFSGFIADEKGLKEFYDIKGQGGTKPCISCKNVKHFLHKKPMGERPASAYVVGLDVTDRSTLGPHSNKSFYAMVDRLRQYANDLEDTELDRKTRSRLRKQLEDTQQLFGLNYNPIGMAFDDELRSVIKPVDHYIRDWQHTLASSGVASTELAACLHAFRDDAVCKQNGLSLQSIEQYCSIFHMRARHAGGKVNCNWFRLKFLAADHVRHFASDVLCMLPLLLDFMTNVVKPLGAMSDHIQSLSLMNQIVSFLRFTYDITPESYIRFRRIVDDHHVIFIRLYSDHVKVKFHHLHLPEDLLRIGTCISCFVTERKHRDWKRFSLYSFRHSEHQSTVDYVNYYVQELASGRFRFSECSLVDAVPVEFSASLFAAHGAFTSAGEIRRGDVVAARGNAGTIVGRVVTCFGRDAETFVQIDAYRLLPGSSCDFSVENATAVFVHASNVVAALMWCARNRQAIHVLLPAELYSKRA